MQKSKPQQQLPRWVVIWLFLLSVGFVGLVGWGGYTQHQLQKTNDLQQSEIKERVAKVEASTIITQEALKINCNGNQTLVFMDIRGYTLSRLCLGFDEPEVELPTVFDDAVLVVNNATDVVEGFNTSALSYYQFPGSTDSPQAIPQFFISTNFNVFCAQLAGYTFPENRAWCMLIDPSNCGFRNVYAANFNASENYPETINLELSVDVTACAAL
jgi:hypothetical protein